MLLSALPDLNSYGPAGPQRKVGALVEPAFFIGQIPLSRYDASLSSPSY